MPEAIQLHRPAALPTAHHDDQHFEHHDDDYPRPTDLLLQRFQLRNDVRRGGLLHSLPVCRAVLSAAADVLLQRVQLRDDVRRGGLLHRMSVCWAVLPAAADADVLL